MDPAPAGTYLFHISDGTDISEERRLDLVGPVGRIYHSSELKSIAVEVGNKGAPGEVVHLDENSSIVRTFFVTHAPAGQKWVLELQAPGSDGEQKPYCLGFSSPLHAFAAAHVVAGRMSRPRDSHHPRAIWDGTFAATTATPVDVLAEELYRVARPEAERLGVSVAALASTAVARHGGDFLACVAHAPSVQRARAADADHGCFVAGVSGGPRDCAVCGEEEVPAADLAAFTCGHAFCVPCWQRYALHLAASATPTALAAGLPCPHPDCTRHGHHMTACWALALGEEAPQPASPTPARWEYAPVLALAADAAVPGICRPTRDDPAVALLSRLHGSTDVWGEGGQNARCSTCMREAHSPLPCAEVDGWLEEVRKEVDSTADREAATRLAQANQTGEWIGSNTRPCPHCGQPIQKSEGCDHMTCDLRSGGCGHQFCWVCLRDWTLHGNFSPNQPQCKVAALAAPNIIRGLLNRTKNQLRALALNSEGMDRCFLAEFALLRSLAQEAGTEDPAAAWALRTLAWAVAARCCSFSSRPDPALQFLWEALYFTARSAAAAHIAHLAGALGEGTHRGEGIVSLQRAMVQAALSVVALHDHAARVGLAPRAVSHARSRGREVTEQLWAGLMATVRCAECHWVHAREAERCPLCRRVCDNWDEEEDEEDVDEELDRGSELRPRAPPRHNILHLYHALATATLDGVLQEAGPAGEQAAEGPRPGKGGAVSDDSGAGGEEAAPATIVPHTVAGLGGCTMPLAVMNLAAARSASAADCIYTAWLASPLVSGPQRGAVGGRHAAWPGWDALEEVDEASWRPLWSSSRLRGGDTVLLAWRHEAGAADAVAESMRDPLYATVHMIGASFPAGAQDVPMLTLARDLPAAHGVCVFRVPFVTNPPRGLSPSWLQLCLKRKGSDHVARTLNTDDAATLSLMSPRMTLSVPGDNLFRVGEPKTVRWTLEGCHLSLVGPFRLSMKIREQNVPPGRLAPRHEVALVDEIDPSAGECLVTVTPDTLEALGLSLDELAAQMQDGSMDALMNRAPGASGPMSVYGTLVLRSVPHPELMRSVNLCRMTATPVLSSSALTHVIEGGQHTEMVSTRVEDVTPVQASETVHLRTGGSLRVQFTYSTELPSVGLDVVVELRQLQSVDGRALQQYGDTGSHFHSIWTSEPVPAQGEHVVTVHIPDGTARSRMQVCVRPVLPHFDQDMKSGVGPDFVAEGTPMDLVLRCPKPFHATTASGAALPRDAPTPVHRDSFAVARHHLAAGHQHDSRVGTYDRYSRVPFVPLPPIEGRRRTAVRALRSMLRCLRPQTWRVRGDEGDGGTGEGEPVPQFRPEDTVVIQAGSTVHVEWSALDAAGARTSAANQGMARVMVEWLDAQDLAHCDRWRHNVREYLDRTGTPVAEVTVPVAEGAAELTIPPSVNLGKTKLEEARLAYVRIQLCQDTRRVLRGGILRVVGSDGLHMIRQAEETWTVGMCFVPPERPNVRLWYVKGRSAHRATCTKCSKTFDGQEVHFDSVAESVTYCIECVRELVCDEAGGDEV